MGASNQRYAPPRKESGQKQELRVIKNRAKRLGTDTFSSQESRSVRRKNRRDRLSLSIINSNAAASPPVGTTPDNTGTAQGLKALSSLHKLGTEVFGKVQLYEKWLDTPLEALNNKKPNDLLTDSAGIKQIKTMLHRIEHGIFA